MTGIDFGSVMQLYRASLRRSWLPSALLAILWTGLFAVMVARLTATDDLLVLVGEIEALMFSRALWLAVILVSLLSTLLYCAMVAAIYPVATGAVPVAVGGKSFGGPPVAGLSVALRVFPAAVVAGGIFLVLTSVGTMALVLPGVYLWGLWQLWIVVLVVERCGPVQSLVRSARLTHGFWWPASTVVAWATLLTMAMFMVFTWVVNVFVNALLAMFGVAIGEGLALSLVAMAMVMTVVLPLIPAALVAIYVARQDTT